MGSCRGGPDAERSGSCSTAFYKNDIISHNDQHLDNLYIFITFSLKSPYRQNGTVACSFAIPPCPIHHCVRDPKEGVFIILCLSHLSGLIRFDSACLA